MSVLSMACIGTGKRDQIFPVTFTDWSDNATVKQVPVADFPTLWAMPIYEYPGIISNTKATETRFGMLYAHRDDASAQKRLRLLSLPGVKSISFASGGVNTWIFARWIAKIGYCYAVARLGVENVKSSPLIDMIINGSQYPNYLIGGLNNLNLAISREFMLEPKSDEVFKVDMRELRASDGKSYICIYIRLLPMLQGATYLAVVCEHNTG